MRILCIGDVFGPQGVNHAAKSIDDLKKITSIDFIICNNENAYLGGRGPSEHSIITLRAKGVSVFTGGNHSFDISNNHFLYEKYPMQLRPCNFPSSSPGVGFYTISYNDYKICVISIQLRVFMREFLSCPFRIIDEILKDKNIFDMIIIVDIHGEATSEKLCFANYIDGRVSAVFGTHTHVQTADARILPNGTGYITDVGMVGPLHSSIGKSFETVTRNLISQMPGKMEDEIKGSYVFSGIIFNINNETHKCDSIERIYWD